jgi:glycosyltransferase involved in cell wall biosynthesis
MPKTTQVTPTQLLPVSVVVTVWQEAATIDGLLAALAVQTSPPAEIIIVDGGSSDQTVAKARQWAARLRPTKLIVSVLPGNRSQGRNRGVALTTQPWLAMTDAGCLPKPEWLAELWQQAQLNWPKDSRTKLLPVVVAGAAVGKAVTSFQSAVIPYVLVMPDRVKAPFLPATRSVLLSKSAWQLLGPFNESLSDNEDYEWSRRLLPLLPQGRVRLAYAARSVVEWLPRTTLQQFRTMIFRFARGDAEAGLWRIQVPVLFGRYGLEIGWLFWLAIMNWQQDSVISPLLWWGTGLVMAVLHLVWPIWKNGKYVSQGWYWLPILQIVTEAMIMFGTVAGLRKRLLLKS